MSTDVENHIPEGHVEVPLYAIDPSGVTHHVGTGLKHIASDTLVGFDYFEESVPVDSAEPPKLCEGEFNAPLEATSTCRVCNAQLQEHYFYPNLAYPDL